MSSGWYQEAQKESRKESLRGLILEKGYQLPTGVV